MMSRIRQYIGIAALTACLTNDNERHDFYKISLKVHMALRNTSIGR